MSGLCHDHNIKSLGGENTCIGHALIFILIKKTVFLERHQMDEKSIHSYLIKNQQPKLWRVCKRANLAETLHVVSLGINDYIAESVELIFTPPTLYLIYHVVIGVYQDSRIKCERDLPDSSHFCHGIMSMKLLKAKERSS